MQNIVITGASGLVATELIHLLLEKGGYKIFAVTTKIEKLKERYADNNEVDCLEIDSLEKELKDQCVDAIIHCAFARGKNPSDIASSLGYTKKIAEISASLKSRKFINISSQSVYDTTEKPFWKESGKIGPDYLYAMGKYAAELICSSVLSGTDINFTNIRLSSVCENARFMNIFVKNILNGDPIKVQGGGQLCSFIDVRDVASALYSIITSEFEFELAYNLGTGTNISILELANIVKDFYEEHYKKTAVLYIEPADIKMEIGMDNSLFCSSFGWHPQHDYEDMVRSLFYLNDESLRDDYTNMNRGGGNANLI